VAAALLPVPTGAWDAAVPAVVVPAWAVGGTSVCAATDALAGEPADGFKLRGAPVPVVAETAGTAALPVARGVAMGTVVPATAPVPEPVMSSAFRAW
jgi:hypothetical protein